ncbi:MAG: hypothetical protein RLZZ338_961, partial [Cyanobacteriota bacterium]
GRIGRIGRIGKKEEVTALVVAIPEIAPTQDPIDIQNLFLIYLRKEHKYQILLGQKVFCRVFCGIY